VQPLDVDGQHESDLVFTKDVLVWFYYGLWVMGDTASCDEI